jgi:hypothetical protein
MRHYDRLCYAMQAADMDKDGMINEEEFWRIMKKGLAC